jgi:hypothetical protein
MKYLIIDASLNGTGIRDKYEGGYISPEDLGLSISTKKKLNEWLLKYENEHYNGFIHDNVIEKLDQEGKEIALLIRNELIKVKVEYFSDARLNNELI